MDKVFKRCLQKIKKRKRSQKHFLIFILATSLMGIIPGAFAQKSRVLDVGIRVQKSVNLYYENGFTVQYSDDALASERLYFGLSYVSSRLGSAIGSNALKQDNYLFSTSFFFRPNRLIRPLIRANIGYFIADIEEAFFDNIPDKSLLLSPEAGICLDPEFPLKFTASLGYNLITGDGIKGPGTLYPVFFQTSLSWDIFQIRGVKR